MRTHERAAGSAAAELCKLVEGGDQTLAIELALGEQICPGVS